MRHKKTIVPQHPFAMTCYGDFNHNFAFLFSLERPSPNLPREEFEPKEYAQLDR